MDADLSAFLEDSSLRAKPQGGRPWPEFVRTSIAGHSQMYFYRGVGPGPDLELTSKHLFAAVYLCRQVLLSLSSPTERNHRNKHTACNGSTLRVH